MVLKLAKILGGGLLLLFLLIAGLALHTWYFRPLQISWFYDRVLLGALLDNPELLTSVGALPTWVGSYDRRLTDASPAFEDHEAEWAAANLAVLRSYDRTALDQEGRLSYDSMEFFLANAVEGDRFRADFPVNQMFGVQATLPNFLIQQHAVRNRREAEDYIARLRLFGWKFDGVLAGLKQRAARGVLPPHFTVTEVLTQMQGFVAKPPTDNPLYVAFADKLGKLPEGTLSATDKDALLHQASDAISAEVYPAYGRLIAYFTDLEGQVTADNGAWSLPQGDAYYAWCVRFHTTTDMTPEQVHGLGLAEVARIEAEMDRALTRLGRSGGTLGQRMQGLSHDPAQFYSNDAAGRAAILKDYTAILSEADQASSRMFNRRPKAKLQVKSVPEFAQATAPGAYYEAGDMSGGRDGVFYFNQRDLGETPKWQMRTLAYHEGIPGHHFQISISQELDQLPPFRQMFSSFLFTAYVEGWGLYAEQLGGEMGLEDNPADALGRLNGEMLRAVRLVVDTGIHLKHWSHDQAVDYMEQRLAMGHADIVSEVERYFVDPGQALAYKVGELKIMALRDQARAALGERFDIKAFHDQILTHGGMPLTALSRVIDDWVAAQGGGPKPA